MKSGKKELGIGKGDANKRTGKTVRREKKMAKGQRRECKKKEGNRKKEMG